jgi:hypothetical protein
MTIDTFFARIDWVKIVEKEGRKKGEEKGDQVGGGRGGRPRRLVRAETRPDETIPGGRPCHASVAWLSCRRMKRQANGIHSNFQPHQESRLLHTDSSSNNV